MRHVSAIHLLLRSSATRVCVYRKSAHDHDISLAPSYLWGKRGSTPSNRRNNDRQSTDAPVPVSIRLRPPIAVHPHNTPSVPRCGGSARGAPKSARQMHGSYAMHSKARG